MLLTEIAQVDHNNLDQLLFGAVLLSCPTAGKACKTSFLVVTPDQPFQPLWGYPITLGSDQVLSGIGPAVTLPVVVIVGRFDDVLLWLLLFHVHPQGC